MFISCVIPVICSQFPPNNAEAHNRMPLQLLNVNYNLK